MSHAGLRPTEALDALFSRTVDPLDRPAVERLAAVLGDPAVLARRLAAGLARVAADPVAQPGLDGIEHEAMRGVVLYRDARLTAMLAVAHIEAIDHRGPAVLNFGAGHMLTVFHARAPVTIELYRSLASSAGRHRFSAARAPACRAAGRREMRAGDWVMSARESETMRIVGARAPVPLVRVYWRGASPLPARRYRWPGGKYLGLTMAREEDARAQLMISALRAMECGDAAEALAGMVESDVFTLRWHAMRAWLAIDVASALPALARMARYDRHPEIRRAATAAQRMVDALAA